MSFILLGILNAQAAAGGGGPVAGYAALETTVDKFAFPSDTRSTLAQALDPNRENGAGFADPAVAGYAAGGQVGGTTYSTVNKFAFPSDARSTLATGLSANYKANRGFSNPKNAGYSAGAQQPTVTTVDKFAFPSDARSTLATGLSLDKEYTATFSNYSVAGYVAGGFSETSSSQTDTVDKFAFPSDARSTLATGLSANVDRAAGLFHNDVAGYVAAGRGLVRNVDKFAFPTDTRSTLSNILNSEMQLVGYFSNSEAAGYVLGGTGDTTGDTVQKLDYASETFTNTTSLSSAQIRVIGFQDA